MLPAVDLHKGVVATKPVPHSVDLPVFVCSYSNFQSKCREPSSLNVRVLVDCAVGDTRGMDSVPIQLSGAESASLVHSGRVPGWNWLGCGAVFISGSSGVKSRTTLLGAADSKQGLVFIRFVQFNQVNNVKRVLRLWAGRAGMESSLDGPVIPSQHQYYSSCHDHSRDIRCWRPVLGNGPDAALAIHQLPWSGT